MPRPSPKSLKRDSKSIEIDGQKADYVHLVGPDDAPPREATLGVILRRPDRVWFFKLRGQAEVVASEKERFEEFVKSVKFKWSLRDGVHRFRNHSMATDALRTDRSVSLPRE